MRASVSMAGDGFARLRHRIAEIEAGAADSRDADSVRTAAPDGAGTGQVDLTIAGRHGRDVVVRQSDGFAGAPDMPTLSARRGSGPLAFGIPGLDAMLAGGLRRGGLHEMRAAESREAGAATGFAAAILARLAADDSRPVLWVIEETAGHEAGLPYGGGLRHFGLDPRRLILVRAGKAADALWVFEEGLRCRGLAAVLTEIRGNPKQLDLTASRRLALRAAAHGVMGLLLRQSNAVTPNAAMTRWRVMPREASVTDGYAAGIGHPGWRLTLERNRLGVTGTFDVEWDNDRHAFATPARPAVSFPLASVPLHRPAVSQDPRSRVADRTERNRTAA